ncbi:MAG: hypothetical protein F4Z17_08130 [Acidimicrobiia bacterium]|nr:hypothetical protein [Acidimicrobiia bacterium]MYB45894.1 hypothetical protein [Acidimicrobiia bacterium]
MTEPQRNAQGFVVNSFEDLGTVLGIMIHGVDSRFSPVDGIRDWLEHRVDTMDSRLEPGGAEDGRTATIGLPRLGRTEPAG